MVLSEVCLKPETYWKNVLWTDESRIQLHFISVWQKPDSAFQHKKFIHTVEHDGGSVRGLAALLPRVQDSLQLLVNFKMLEFSKEFCRRLSICLLTQA